MISIAIRTAAELQAISAGLSKNYVLMNDIDCSNTSTWNSGFGFVPIGDNGGPFTGTLNGNGYKIKNLTIAWPISYSGLFGGLSGAKISNIIFTDYNISAGDYYVGGVCGIDLTGSSITGCRIESGSISATGSYIGGICGKTNSSAIVRCSNVVNITSPSGGVYIGGICGYLNGGGTYADLYNRGVITGVPSGNVGGCFGYNGGCTIYRCYSTGDIGNTSNGGLVGASGGGAAVNCFWDTQASGSTNSALGTGKTTEEMKTQSTFTNWTFGFPFWQISASVNNGYPYLLSPIRTANFESSSGVNRAEYRLRGRIGGIKIFGDY